MPVRERVCVPCGQVYEIIERRRDGQMVVEPYGDTMALSCPACSSEDFTTRFPAPLPVGLGGEAGVGKFYPYYDRALGPGRGKLVKSAQHRKRLLTHFEVRETQRDGSTAVVRKPREIPLTPVDSNAPSALSGTWDDIATRDAYEIEKHEKAGAAIEKELTEGPNRAAYAKLKEQLPQLVAQPVRTAPE